MTTRAGGGSHELHGLPPLKHLQALSEELATLVAAVVPCVIALSGANDDFSASGSGFFIDGKGHAVTNQHVVNGLEGPLDAVLHGGIRTKATLLGADEICDLAVVHVEAAPEHFLAIRDEPARLGELCVAIGSPFGAYPESVSMGVVSGIARTIRQGDGSRPIDQAIQTDAAVNPGNSGGPLVDVSGCVIGVNQSIDARGQSIGFAVPADVLRWVSGELIANGTVVRGTLGATVVKQAVTVNGASRVGLNVIRVAEGPPPAPDGLAVGDVIVQAGDTPVDEPGDLYRVLTKEAIGKTLTLQVVRDGTLQPVTVVPTKLGG
jgi:S1-C subfamily serine protease